MATATNDVAVGDAARAREEAGLLEAVLARVRALALRRLRWLESLAGDAREEDLGDALPVRLRVALLDLDSPQEESRFYRSGARCRELSAQAENYAELIADAEDNALAHLFEVLGVTRAEAELLQVCLAAQLDPGLAQIYGYLEGDVARRGYATEALAARLCGYGRASMWSPAGALARWQVLEAEEADPGGAPPPLKLAPPALHSREGGTDLARVLLGSPSSGGPPAPLPRWPVEEVSR